jgi:tRNA (adenine-N(1)-)-methyltransferase non-catalytic subunit
VPAAELHAETLSNDVATPAESRDEKTIDTPTGAGAEDAFDVVTDDGALLIRNNRLTVDDPSRQALTHDEIEALKKAGTGSGREIIAKIMAAHSALSEKTQFSLAKYTLRKSRKYMRRFTVLPVDISVLVKVWTEKDPSRIMEVREEGLGLLMSWGNVHWHRQVEREEKPRGRYLVIDDTCGLVVAAMAERMGILYPEDEEEGAQLGQKQVVATEGGDTEMTEATPSEQPTTSDPSSERLTTTDRSSELPTTTDPSSEPKDEDTTIASPTTTKPPSGPYTTTKRPAQSSARSNSITLLHANTQPNISLLEPFSYDADRPSPTHPLHAHLRTLTWLQLLDPTSDTLYKEPAPPEPANEEEAKLSLHAQIANLKSGKRSAYWKKRKRWERVRSIVDETRAGEFDALIIATAMDLTAVLKHLVPLLRGGGNIAIYSPTVEPLTKVMDFYSRERRAGYTKFMQAAQEAGNPDPDVDEEDFPVDPTLVLNPMLQTARAREWQVLPMRTHPHMTGRGGAEGYVFTGTRVLPVKGVKVEAKGKFGKKRKAEANEEKAAKKVEVEEGGKDETVA